MHLTIYVFTVYTHTMMCFRVRLSRQISTSNFQVKENLNSTYNFQYVGFWMNKALSSNYFSSFKLFIYFKSK